MAMVMLYVYIHWQVQGDVHTTELYTENANKSKIEICGGWGMTKRGEKREVFV